MTRELSLDSAQVHYIQLYTFGEGMTLFLLQSMGWIARQTWPYSLSWQAVCLRKKWQPPVRNLLPSQWWIETDMLSHIYILRMTLDLCLFCFIVVFVLSYLVHSRYAIKLVFSLKNSSYYKSNNNKNGLKWCRHNERNLYMCMCT